MKARFKNLKNILSRRTECLHQQSVKIVSIFPKESRLQKAGCTRPPTVYVSFPTWLLSLFAGRDKIRDQSKFLEEICVFAFSYVINDQGNGFERKELRNFELIGK